MYWPHQVYINPYDPERHIWVVERDRAQVLKFTNDGSELVMRIGDPDHPRSQEEARANPNPGPFSYGMPAVLAFLPDGSFYLGDGLLELASRQVRRGRYVRDGVGGVR